LRPWEGSNYLEELEKVRQTGSYKQVHHVEADFKDTEAGYQAYHKEAAFKAHHKDAAFKA